MTKGVVGSHIEDIAMLWEKWPEAMVQFDHQLADYALHPCTFHRRKNGSIHVKATFPSGIKVASWHITSYVSRGRSCVGSGLWVRATRGFKSTPHRNARKYPVKVPGQTLDAQDFDHYITSLQHRMATALRIPAAYLM